MNGIPAFIPAFASVAISSLLASIWQGAVLVAAVALALRLTPGLTASVRSAIWSGVLLLVAGLPVMLWFWPHAHAHRTQPHAMLQLNTTLALALAGLWLAISLLRFAHLAISAIHLQVLVNRSVPFTASTEIRRLLRHGKRPVQLCTSLDVDRPSVAGFWHPRILLPAHSVWRPDTRDLEQVVLHEMEHLRRRDEWVNLLQKLALALFPLHPVLAWLDRRVSYERELACDDDVLRRTRAPKAYAECLTRLAESRTVQRGFSLVLGALGPFGRKPELVRRVQRILSAPQVRMGRFRSVAVTASLLLAMVTGASMLARSPRLIDFNEVASQPQVLQARVEATPQANGGGARALLVSARAPLSVAQAKSIGTTVGHFNRGIALQTRAPRGWSPQPSWIPVRRFSRHDRVDRVTLATFSTDLPSPYAFIATRDGWLLVQL